MMHYTYLAKKRHIPSAPSHRITCQWSYDSQWKNLSDFHEMWIAAIKLRRKDPKLITKRELSWYLTFYKCINYNAFVSCVTDDGFDVYNRVACFDHSSVCSRITAEFCAAFRRWFGLRWSGVFWTPKLSHPESRQTSGERAAFYRLLRHESRVQPLQVKPNPPVIQPIIHMLIL